jgi:hypothetical protein
MVLLFDWVCDSLRMFPPLPFRPVDMLTGTPDGGMFQMAQV